MSSLFYTKLSEGGKYDFNKAKAYTSAATLDLLHIDMLGMLIHGGVHWKFAAIDFRKQCISLLDSSEVSCHTGRRAAESCAV